MRIAIKYDDIDISSAGRGGSGGPRATHRQARKYG